MKKYILLTACILSVAFSTSCKKALEEKMHDAISPSNFYKTAQDAEAALNGVYSPLQYQNYYQRTNYILTDLSSDIYHCNNANAPRLEIQHLTVSPTNGLNNDYWMYSYMLIKNANDVILYVPDIKMDEASKNNILGNAYFLRGMAYFDLVRLYGDVPLVLKNTGDQDLFPKRTPSDQVYSQIIEDLQFAEANCVHMHQLPAEQVGRVTSEAASAMLARVYLQRSSTSFAGATDNQNVLDECNKVIAYSTAHPDVLTLVPNYQDIFDVTKKNGPECIFSVQFGEPPVTSNNISYMFTPATINGWASFLPYDSFVNSYDPADLRRAYNLSIVVDGVTYISKYVDPEMANSGRARQNWVVLRYADVLLMQSEAMNNINPGDAGKFEGINAIRTRAGLGDKLLDMSNTPTSDDFINALANERLWEMPVEGVRRYDLIRWGKMIDIKNAQGNSADANHLFLPIPQNEMDTNKNLVQNTGY
jgi:starch-binding outer membrane protein, SusD/RagB family